MSMMNKRNTFDSVNATYEGQEFTLNAFKSRIFSLKLSQEKWLKILTFQKILQRLSVALTQVKAGSMSEKLRNEMRQVIYYLYCRKEII